MALLTLEEAAVRIGVPRETLKDWVQQGLLTVHGQPPRESPTAEPPGVKSSEEYVDEEELFERAESLGWFELSAENWDDDEGE
jgi:hypothetical protein